jgi:hypothetical protein
MKRTGALIVGVALAMSLSGCFVFGTMKWDPAVVKAGKKTQLVVKLIPETSNVGARDSMVPFVLVGLDDGGVLALKGKRELDPKGDFGGPYTMFADGAMEAEATSTEDCGLGSGRLNEVVGVDWTLLRTDERVNDKDKTKPALATIGIKTSALAGNGQVQAYVFSGNWSDEGPENGMIDDQEVVCAGGGVTNLTLKG